METCISAQATGTPCFLCKPTHWWRLDMWHHGLMWVVIGMLHYPIFQHRHLPRQNKFESFIWMSTLEPPYLDYWCNMAGICCTLGSLIYCLFDILYFLSVTQQSTIILKRSGKRVVLFLPLLYFPVGGRVWNWSDDDWTAPPCEECERVCVSLWVTSRSYESLLI